MGRVSAIFPQFWARNVRRCCKLRDIGEVRPQENGSEQLRVWCKPFDSGGVQQAVDRVSVQPCLFVQCGRHHKTRVKAHNVAGVHPILHAIGGWIQQRIRTDLTCFDQLHEGAIVMQSD